MVLFAHHNQQQQKEEVEEDVESTNILYTHAHCTHDIQHINIILHDVVDSASAIIPSFDGNMNTICVCF